MQLRLALGIRGWVRWGGVGVPKKKGGKMVDVFSPCVTLAVLGVFSKSVIPIALGGPGGKFGPIAFFHRFVGGKGIGGSLRLCKRFKLCKKNQLSWQKCFKSVCYLQQLSWVGFNGGKLIL